MKLLVVSPRIGARWVREGLVAFRRAPMAFFSLFMIFMAAMALLASLPLSMRDRFERVGVIGFGSGMTTHTLLADPRHRDGA